MADKSAYEAKREKERLKRDNQIYEQAICPSVSICARLGTASGRCNEALLPFSMYHEVQLETNPKVAPDIALSKFADEKIITMQQCMASQVILLSKILNKRSRVK